MVRSSMAWKSLKVICGPGGKVPRAKPQPPRSRDPSPAQAGRFLDAPLFPAHGKAPLSHQGFAARRLAAEGSEALGRIHGVTDGKNVLLQSLGDSLVIGTL